MKKNTAIKTGIILLICLLLPGISYINAQQQHDPIEESVTVTNIEVPVRVLYKGKPVDNLTKEDFTVYENKKKMTINGFYIKRKKITMSTKVDAPAEDKETGVKTIPAPPRTFVLIFNVTDYNYSFKGAIEYLFENVLRDRDNVLIFANDKEFNFSPVKDKKKVRATLEEALKIESQKSRLRLTRYINQMETYLKTNDFRMSASIDPVNRKSRSQKLLDYLKKVSLAWNDYKKKYLTPKVDRFYYFARYLQKVKTEKWVLNFYQFELFPKIRVGSDAMHKMRDLAQSLISSGEGGQVAHGRLINTILNELVVDFNINKNFPNEEITKLFYKVDATFYSFFIKSTSKSLSGDFDYREVSSDLEMLLKQITDTTGGRNFTTNDVKSALETVREIEDVYYVLTYAPKDSRTKGKLKIKVKNRKYKVLYDNNFRENYIEQYWAKLSKKLKTPDIKVEDVSFKRKNLKFTVKSYMIRHVENKAVGRFKVRIRIINRADNKPAFDSQKVLTATKKETAISLPPQAFKRVTRGEYNIMIDITDMFTGKVDNFHKVTKVSR